MQLRVKIKLKKNDEAHVDRTQPLNLAKVYLFHSNTLQEVRNRYTNDMDKPQILTYKSDKCHISSYISQS